eukprot:gb/GFBE01016379.1/.p1 GENE.gb/GFBE01016379.1/~~gb/GFBE01016379.1/.p1  ORF type:complete len:314 (+),score=57.75 gb/GFBE01016379.1/:1-942(+)
MKEERYPVKGKRTRKEQVTKHGLRGEYQEDVLVEEDVVIDCQVAQVPEYYDEAVEREIYEEVMNVVTRDATMDFVGQYPLPALPAGFASSGDDSKVMSAGWMVSGVSGVIGAVVLSITVVQAREHHQREEQLRVQLLEEKVKRLESLSSAASGAAPPAAPSTPPLPTHGLSAVKSTDQPSACQERNGEGTELHPAVPGSLDGSSGFYPMVSLPCNLKPAADPHTSKCGPVGSVLLEVGQLVNPKSSNCLLAMIREKDGNLHLTPFDGDRSYSRFWVPFEEEERARQAVKAIGYENGKRPTVKIVEQRFDLPRD